MEVLECYNRPQETWSVAFCRKLARARCKDGLGTSWPYRGHIIGGSGAIFGFGLTRYNGGVEREGKLYRSEYRAFPKLPKGFAIMRIVSWGYRLVDLQTSDLSAYTGPVVAEGL